MLYNKYTRRLLHRGLSQSDHACSIN